LDGVVASHARSSENIRANRDCFCISICRIRIDLLQNSEALVQGVVRRPGAVPMAVDALVARGNLQDEDGRYISHSSSDLMTLMFRALEA
jgi:hypothetical protein